MTMTDEQRAVYDTVTRMLKDVGIPVEVLTDEQMEQLSEVAQLRRGKKAAPETALPGEGTPFRGTVISSADGAKVIQNLEKLAQEYKKNTATKEKTFIGNVAQALNARRYGSGSEYATFETLNGNVVTIRLSSHNASTKNFDNAG